MNPETHMECYQSIWGKAIWKKAIWGKAIWGKAIWGKAIWGKAIWGKAKLYPICKRIFPRPAPFLLEGRRYFLH